MHVTVTFRHLDSSDALRRYAEEKTERLVKYLIEPAEVHWVLSVEKIRHIADVTIVTNGVTIKAQEDTEDMYSAIDLVIDKLEKQVKRYKERLKDHKTHGNLPPTKKIAIPSQEDSARKPRIVKTENMFIKPMSVEEALMQLELLDNDFLVFTNSSTSNINVLYRRKDGDYGLIETQTR